MATAKTKRQVTVEDHRGKKVKVECAACFDEYESYACLRPAHINFPVESQASPECKTCYDYKGSYVCRNPKHDAFKAKTKVVQKEDAPVEKEVLATAIVAISEAVDKLYKSGLNRKAVVALIADDTKLGKGTIETVISSLLDLRKTYTK